MFYEWLSLETFFSFCLALDLFKINLFDTFGNSKSFYKILT